MENNFSTLISLWPTGQKKDIWCCMFARCMKKNTYKTTRSYRSNGNNCLHCTLLHPHFVVLTIKPLAWALSRREPRVRAAQCDYTLRRPSSHRRLIGLLADTATSAVSPAFSSKIRQPVKPLASFYLDLAKCLIWNWIGTSFLVFKTIFVPVRTNTSTL